MSERSQIAEQIAQFIRDNNLTNPFGGDVSKMDRYYSVLFSRPATLDGLVRVYSPSFILIEFSGKYGREQRVYVGSENAIQYIKLRFVDFDETAANAIPTKPRKVAP
jgi:hypothetical protein